MELIFNAESLRPPITGVGNYSLYLLRALLQNQLVSGVHSFSGTGWRSGEAQLEISMAARGTEQGADASLANITASLRSIVTQIPGARAGYQAVMRKRFSGYANALPGAVYHETNYILKPCNKPSVVTVHDTTHIRFPEFHKPRTVEYLNKYLPQSVERADHIITHSNIVRDEVIEHFGVSPDDVSAVYLGFDELYRQRSEQECQSVLQNFNLDYQNYVLMVATLEPRKGIGALLDSWQLLPAELRKAHPLVLTGSSGWRNSVIRKQMAFFIAEGSVKHLGYVPAQALPALLSGALLFCYPSVYEGFGMPVLDAMASGVPVICRAGTSMAEFAEGSCLLFDSEDPEELAQRLELMLSSREERQLWKERGLAQAKKFSWQKCAEETSAIYRQVC